VWNKAKLELGRAKAVRARKLRCASHAYLKVLKQQRQARAALIKFKAKKTPLTRSGVFQ
jgi:hypothetical protein